MSRNRLRMSRDQIDLFQELVDKVVIEPSSSVKDALDHPNVEDVAYKTSSCSTRVHYRSILLLSILMLKR
jgi:hypothetical protein